MKFRFKITLCMLALLSISFGTGASLIIYESFQDSLEREQETAFSVYRMVWSTLQIVNDLNPYLDQNTINQTLEQLGKQKRTAWTALRLSTEKEVIYQSADFDFPMLSTPEPAPGDCQFFTALGLDGTHYLILYGAANSSDTVLYLYMVQDISNLYTMRQIQQNTYLQIFIILLMLCAVLAYTVSRLLTAPLQKLSMVSRKIASGKLSSRVNIASNDEVGAVAEDFNAMAQQMEETISELNNAIASQERFVGSFAHEMKTPMTSLIGYAELLRSGVLTPDEQAEAAYYIYAEGKRLENLSRKLLDLLVLKHKNLPLIKIRPADLIEGLIERLQPICTRRNISLSCDCQKGTCYLEPDLVWSLLLNLADNAQKAMPQGGHIHLRLQMLPDGCRIYVFDNGQGIPETALAHLTEAFYRADKARSREQGGFGLGLALCQEIVALHNGQLKFTNRPEGGACVIAELRGGRP